MLFIACVQIKHLIIEADMRQIGGDIAKIKRSSAQFDKATVCSGEHVFQIANRFSDRRNKKSETLDKRSILPYTKGKKRA